MFENMIAGAIDPEMAKILKLVQHALEGVKTRLEAQHATGEPIAMLSAKAQLDAIAAWAPAVDEMLKALEAKPVAHPPLPTGHR
jgi:hypothetical protein